MPVARPEAESHDRDGPGARPNLIRPDVVVVEADRPVAEPVKGLDEAVALIERLSLTVPLGDGDDQRQLAWRLDDLDEVAGPVDGAPGADRARGTHGEGGVRQPVEIECSLAS